MPRTQLSKKQDARRDLINAIRSTMREKHITQAQIGRILKKDPSTISYKIQKLNFDYDQMVEILEILEFAPEEILYFASGGRYRRTTNKNDQEAV